MRNSFGITDNESGAPAQGNTVSPHALSDLIGSIYDCALDPSHWERTLAEITQAISCESAILSLNDLRHDRLLIHRSVGWGQSGIEERQKHIPEIHARLTEWFAKGPSLDEPFVASRQLSPDYLESAPYVQRCLKPLAAEKPVVPFTADQHVPQARSTFAQNRVRNSGVSGPNRPFGIDRTGRFSVERA